MYDKESNKLCSAELAALMAAKDKLAGCLHMA